MLEGAPHNENIHPHVCAWYLVLVCELPYGMVNSRCGQVYGCTVSPATRAVERVCVGLGNCEATTSRDDVATSSASTEVLVLLPPGGELSEH